MEIVNAIRNPAQGVPADATDEAVVAGNKLYELVREGDGTERIVEYTETRRLVRTRETEAKVLVGRALVAFATDLPASPLKTALADMTPAQKVAMRDRIYAELNAANVIKHTN